MSYSSVSVALVTTIALAVPAGWHMLDADIQTDGPSIRPDQSTVHIDDAVISVQLDRGAIVAGGTVSAILVATSDRPHAVTVDMRTLEDMGMGGERVPNPPLQVDRRSVVLQAQPGGGPPVVASVKLGSRRQHAGGATWYDVYVTRHGDNGRAATAAIAGVATWSGNSFALTIEPPARISAEGPFTIALRVKNTMKTSLADLRPEVGGRLEGWNGMESNFEIGADDYDVEQVEDPDPAPTTNTETGDDGSLAVGAERLFVYRVTPKRAGISHFTFVAHVRANSAGAMEIASFDRPAKSAEPASHSLAAR